RFGKAVEINALWHSALTSLSRRRAPQHASKHASKLDTCATLARKVARSFNDTFWNDDAGCLYDHIAPGDAGSPRPDGSIRPNQVFAVSLPHSPLPLDRQKQVVAVVRDRLLTPVGLRTLPVDDPA